MYWFQTALQTQENDDHGEFDATMSDPNYLILATQAEMYLSGKFGLEKDPLKSGKPPALVSYFLEITQIP